jgi:hypothetical protein
MNGVKPGRASTEFGLTAIVGALAAMRESTEGLSTPELIAVASVLVAYILARAYVKGQAAQPAPLVGEKIGHEGS